MKYAIFLTLLSVIGSLITCYRKKIKMSINHVIPSPEQLKNMHIVNGIILILILLTIVMFSIIRFNQP
jgi:uncharacterized membrane protein (UPF0136 family)